MIIDEIATDIASAERALAAHQGHIDRSDEGFNQLAGEVQKLLADISPHLTLERLQIAEGVGVNAFWFHTADHFMRQTMLPQTHWI